MPQGAARPKAAQVERLGGQITYCEPTLAAREAAAERIRRETGASLVHPYDNPLVMAGQGTAVLELIEDAPDVEVVMAPIGGGGLISGTATAAKALKPDVRVIGVEPELADDAARSLRAGRRIPLEHTDTIADGLRASLSLATFAHIRARVDEVATASEAAIVEAMRVLWETLRVIVEPSAAVPYAAIREGRADVRGRTVGIIVSGGNADLDKLPWATR
jgi:threonine dehydratase